MDLFPFLTRLVNSTNQFLCFLCFFTVNKRLLTFCQGFIIVINLPGVAYTPVTLDALHCIYLVIGIPISAKLSSVIKPDDCFVRDQCNQTIFAVNLHLNWCIIGIVV